MAGPMERFDRMSLKKWMGLAAGALALAGLLAVLSTAVLGAFEDGAQAPEVIHRTARPATATRTPTISPTPTITLTPSETPTPTMTPTPFPPKDPLELGNTVMIGGSTGDETLSPFGVNYVAMFDGAVSTSFSEVAHVVLPGAITHLTVKLDQNISDEYIFALTTNGGGSLMSCIIPAKGKGDFCEAGDKDRCIEVGPQDVIAVLVAQSGSGGQVAGKSQTPVRMSWVAKLDLYGTCEISCTSAGSVAGRERAREGEAAGPC